MDGKLAGGGTRNVDATEKTQRDRMRRMPSRQPEIRAVNDRVKTRTIRLIKADPTGSKLWKEMQHRAEAEMAEEIEAAYRRAERRLGHTLQSPSPSTCQADPNQPSTRHTL